MLKTNYKLKEKGITLIALIITIIVMLILTGVVLSVTLGDNGLVNKAKEATTQTQVAMDRELLLSAVVGAIGLDGNVDLTAINLPEGFTVNGNVYTSKNGNNFTVSSNGEVVYTGSDDIIENGGEIANVDLNGKYYFNGSEDVGYFMEFINYDTFKEGSDEEEYSFPLAMNIDEKSQSGTIAIYYDYDENTLELGEPEQGTFTYDLVMEGNNIVNKIICMKFEGQGDTTVLYQNRNGFEYNLDGIYLDEEGTHRLIFNSESRTADLEYKDGSNNWNPDSSYRDMMYFYYNGIYSLDGRIIYVSDNTITTVDGDGDSRVYTKQN